MVMMMIVMMAMGEVGDFAIALFLLWSDATRARIFFRIFFFFSLL